LIVSAALAHVSGNLSSVGLARQPRG
jgi:hypothetical protein